MADGYGKFLQCKHCGSLADDAEAMEHDLLCAIHPDAIKLRQAKTWSERFFEVRPRLEYGEKRLAFAEIEAPKAAQVDWGERLPEFTLEKPKVEESLIEATIRERGARYGRFSEDARIAEDLKAVMRSARGYKKLPPFVRAALEHFAVKIARILNGDPLYVDNWLDVAGYATLVRKEIEAGAK